MRKIILEARAKINLTLDVLNKREDGYHNVKMVMQQIDLCDHIHLISCSDENCITIECSHPCVPFGEGNIAYKAAQLVRDTFEIDKGIIIKIEKNIPVAAGLAGGSTDAAAVIEGLNRLWELNMDIDQMMELGKKLGADVPFCILGGTALAEGIGEILTPFETSVVLDLLLIKPDIMVSTAWAYGNLNLDDMNIRPDSDKIIKALKEGDKYKIAAELSNVFETVTVVKYPEIVDIKKTLLQKGALGAVMTGSGPTVVGIYRNKGEAETAAEHFRHNYKEVFVTRTFNR